MIYRPFDKQKEVLLDQSRTKVLIAAKRAGKSEAAYLDTVIKADQQPHYWYNGRDPYMCAIVAPTHNMMQRLVWPKFRKFAEPFEKEFNKSEQMFYWNTNNSIVMGVSAEKIKRLEGFKLNHIHMTEAFQMNEEVYLECVARISDTRKSSLTIDGSLGPNIPNPKLHWIYKTFVQKKDPNARVWEWATADNPHFPQEELHRLKDVLDPRTYRQMFTIDWNVPGTAVVYDEFDEGNTIKNYQYNRTLDTYVSIDWGWAHNMAALFFQHDRRTDEVYLFDEIVSSRITLDQLWDRIKSKGYNIKHWVCDIAGNQEREQTGYSNVKWFGASPRNISFKYRSSAINYGLPIVRAYIKNGLGQRRFKIDEIKCPKSLDGIRNYRYHEKDGIIQNENPLKMDDDAVDAIRYFFVNILDPNKPKDTFVDLNRWKVESHANPKRY
jgi:PBSX family phage terminase large subunit